MIILIDNLIHNKIFTNSSILLKESFIKPCITTQRDFIQNNLIYFDITRISLQISFISKRLTTRINHFPHETFRATRYIQTFEIIIKLHIVPSSKKNLESLDNLVEKQMHPLFIIRDAFPSSVKREKAVITLERRSARSRNTNDERHDRRSSTKDRIIIRGSDPRYSLWSAVKFPSFFFPFLFFFFFSSFFSPRKQVGETNYSSPRRVVKGEK